MRREPLLNAGAVGAVVAALLTLLTAWGLDLSDAQRTSVLGFVAVVTPLVVAWFSRGSVTPGSDPRDNAGNPLLSVEAATTLATAASVTALDQPTEGETEGPPPS